MGAWVACGLVLVATVFDLHRREVPDAIPVLLLGWAVLAVVLSSTAAAGGRCWLGWPPACSAVGSSSCSAAWAGAT